MALIAWTEAYAVKVRAFDQQHRKLFDLVNQLHDAMQRGQGKNVVGPVLQMLIRYTIEHFAEEEKAMLRANYPNLAQHCAEHRELIRKVEAFNDEFNAGRTAVSAPLLNTLRDWLTKHIRGTDQQYSAFLNAAGVA